MNVEVDTTFRLLVAELSGHREELVADYISRLGEELPEWSVERPELADTIRAGANAAIGGELRALAEGELPASCPEVDAEGTRQCVRLGVPLEAVILQYRLGHAVQWDAWFELVEQQGLSAAQRRELLERGSRFFFDYANTLTRFVVAEYNEERESLLRQSEQRRVFVVRELLAGRDPGAEALGYDLSYQHLGVIAWGDGPGDAIRALAGRLDRVALIVSAGEGECWGWLGGVHPLGRLPGLQPGKATRLAFGDEAPGIEGFRRTHTQALVARRAAEARGAETLRYEDVALEALAGADRDAAREFVARELRGLDAADNRSARLRETLTAYFRSGQNAAAAGAALGVHQQTVGHRLRKIEEQLGAPVIARRAELEVALRLRDFLGDQ